MDDPHPHPPPPPPPQKKNNNDNNNNNNNNDNDNNNNDNNNNNNNNNDNNQTRILYYIKFCVSFQIYQWIQTGVTVRKRPIWVKFNDFLSHVTLQFDIWPWKTIGHLFYLHHFVAIGEFKLELQSGNAKSGSNSTIFRAVWPYYLTDDLEKQ